MVQSPSRTIIWMIVIMCFTSSYVVSFEDDAVTVTVSNRTPYFLHVMINNVSYLYVAPGGSALTETDLSTAFVEVFYSPGQGISGRAVRDLTSETTYTYDHSSSNTCQNNSSSGCQVNESSSSVSGRTRSPMFWDVSPADLSTDSTLITNQ